MRSLFYRRWWCVVAVCLMAAVAVAFAAHRRTGPATLILTVDHDLLPANGYEDVRVTAKSSDGRELRAVTWRVTRGKALAEVESGNNSAVLQGGVTPGDVELVAEASGLKPARIDLRLALDPSDEIGDGTPDFLRLQDAADRIAFRRWFTFLAESTYFQKEDKRPKEINDCAALIRYAYREALHGHDGSWASEWHLEHLPTAASVRKYDYPHTALGPNIFRTRPGSFEPNDVGDGVFAEFADAETLRRFNTHFVSRDLRAARPGDLIFFRQSGQRMPFHTMIYLGPSQFDDESDSRPEAWLIYHTGPSQNGSSHEDRGELRRVTVGDLMQHPYARWRPVPQNAAFLGVYRWNILREAN
jgi:uncharacterized protein YfaT (DUF1175 family)